MKEERSRGTQRAREQESGQPGGGKGRKEDVRGSGIYPASGPLPPSPAPIKTARSMGRRERAVGGSSRTVAAHARTPVKWVGAHRDLARLAAEAPRDLPRGEWKDFLDEFSVEREGWQTEMRVFQPDQTSRIEIRGLPLEGISIDLEPTEATTLITVGKETFDHLTHTIPRTTRVTLLNESELEIESADRGRTLVRCSPP